MTSEFPHKENRPERRVSAKDQQRLDELAFLAGQIMGRLREGTTWAALYAYLTKMGGVVQWAHRDAQIDLRTQVQATGDHVAGQMQRGLDREGTFKDLQVPDQVPPEWTDPTT